MVLRDKSGAGTSSGSAWWVGKHSSSRETRSCGCYRGCRKNGDGEEHSIPDEKYRGTDGQRNATGATDFQGRSTESMGGARPPGARRTRPHYLIAKWRAYSCGRCPGRTDDARSPQQTRELESSFYSGRALSARSNQYFLCPIYTRSGRKPTGG